MRTPLLKLVVPLPLSSSFISGTQCRFAGSKARTAGTGATGGAGTAAHKLVVVVRDDLKMDKGKIAVQCSHAALLSYISPPSSPQRKIWKSNWQEQGEEIIPLRIPDLDTLNELILDAKDRGLPTVVVRDAGRTQVARGSETVLGIGPGDAKLIDEVCGHLPPL